jgi:hypothetical protein
VSTFNLHILLEQTDSGRTIASIAELSNCHVEADTRREALEAIQSLASDRLNNVEIVPLEITDKKTIRFPSLNAKLLRSRVERFIECSKDELEDV